MNKKAHKKLFSKSSFNKLLQIIQKKAGNHLSLKFINKSAIVRINTFLIISHTHTLAGHWRLISPSKYLVTFSSHFTYFFFFSFPKHISDKTLNPSVLSQISTTTTIHSTSQWTQKKQTKFIYKIPNNKINLCALWMVFHFFFLMTFSWISKWEMCDRVFKACCFWRLFIKCGIETQCFVWFLPKNLI